MVVISLDCLFALYIPELKLATQKCQGMQTKKSQRKLSFFIAKGPGKGKSSKTENFKQQALHSSQTPWEKNLWPHPHLCRQRLNG